MAAHDAVTQAVYRVYGTRQKLGPQADDILMETFHHAAGFVSEQEVRGESVQAGVAVVDVLMKVDGAALRDYLNNTHGLELIQQTEGKFNVFVLAYTVEGGDPDPYQNKSREVVMEHDAYGRAVDDAHTSTQASASNTDYANASRNANASASASDSQVAKAHAGSDEVFGTQQAGAVAAADRQRQHSASASEDATRYKDANAQYAHDAEKHSELALGVHNYLRVTDYLDTTKKGVGVTNEVKAKLEEMLQSAGLDVKLYSLELMNKQFGTEDELYTSVLRSVHSDPDVQPGDYLALALNRLTPIRSAGPRRYTSEITYRVVRISDGHMLLPAKNVLGDSGNQVSEDMARSTATEIGINKAAGVLPNELTAAIRKLDRESSRNQISSSTVYVIRVDNVLSPDASERIKGALRAAGFTIKQQFRGTAHSETITVELNGRNGGEVSSLVQSNRGSLNLSNIDDTSAILAAR